MLTALQFLLASAIGQELSTPRKDSAGLADHDINTPLSVVQQLLSCSHVAPVGKLTVSLTPSACT